MGEPSHSLWDTLVELRLPRLAAFGFTPGDIRAKRCRLRISRYEHAASTGLIDPTLAEDLADRRRRWEMHLESPDAPVNDRPRKDWSWWDFFLVGWDELFLGAAIIGGILFAIVGVALAAVWIPLHILRFIRRTRCRRALNQSCCPDCGYDLTGIPDQIEGQHMDEQHVGPSRCPECASPWPLLPPPVPGPT